MKSEPRSISVRALQLFVLLLASSLLLPAYAALPIPEAPQLSASSYILEDYQTGTILAEKNADEKVAPASITKLMTLYVVFHALKSGAINPDDMVTISEKAWRMGGSRMFIEVGNKVSVENLIEGVVVASGNDAAVALAEFVGGTEGGFVNMMNTYAQRLGMTNSHFTDASGLPHPNHYMTARDIATLARAIIRDFPKYYHQYFADKEFTWNNIHQTNRNLLLWRDPSVDGLKTGHTNEAGYCLVTSAKRGNMRLIAVVMGTDSEEARANQNEALLNYGYHFFEGRTLYAAGSKLTEAKVWKGSADMVPIGVKSDLYVVVPKGRAGKLDASMKLPATIVAPVDTDQPIGKVQVTMGGEPVASAPLYALDPVAKGGLWTRMMDSVVLMFH
ncbi:MAG TPA: D-alanyl-D-alanine carboxypeptidase family protein [Gammaproteobacteria bacterium]|nr:D-alanyl-D-alanine carboxypeptidase family protein [Gammaproteobacteria bacterium]